MGKTISELIDEYEFEDDTIGTLADDIRTAVMRLAFGSGPETYRFNQIGAIYTALGELLDARAEMKFTFNQVVDLVSENKDNTN